MMMFMEEPLFLDRPRQIDHGVVWKFGALAGFIGIALHLIQYILKLYPTPFLGYLATCGLVIVWTVAVMDFRSRNGNLVSFRKAWTIAFLVATVGHIIQFLWLLLQLSILIPDSEALYMSELHEFLRNWIPYYWFGTIEVTVEQFWFLEMWVFLSLWVFYAGPTMIIAAFLKRG